MREEGGTMRRWLRRLGILLLILVVASCTALYSYGRFAEAARGPASMSLPIAADATPLDRAIAPLLREHPGRSGMALLQDNLDAFTVRAATARAAGRSLDLQYYIWNQDFTGNLLSYEALRAADRGVRVRLLLDDMTAHGKDSQLAALDAHANIEVRLFNPSRSRAGVLGRASEMLLRPVSMNRRMHNKAWIADGRVAVVGGRNVGDEYFDAAAQTNFLDLDAALIGPAVAQAAAIFDDFWNSASVIPLAALTTAEEGALERLRENGDAGYASAQAGDYVARLRRSPGVRALVGGTTLHWLDDVGVYSDPASKGQGEGQGQWLVHRLGRAMGEAKRQLRVISPYFVPGDEGARWLVARRAQGVDVGVLTNSLAANDVMAVHGGYAPYRVALLEGGVTLFELMPHGEQDSSLFGSSGASLHTKAFVVDDDAGFIGSFNLDPRSVNLNTEMGVLFRDRGAAAALLRSYQAKIAPDRSYRVSLKDGALRWEDASTQPPKVWEREPEASAWRRWVARAVGWLPIESQL
ncbi:phospholipase D family protein [Pseudoxanthomonas sp. PXM03]|uniref:phospholipase D family protein n=1 Tax=Pseudoxanthomonas sp. PXM03 TaxID=2769284 RepID=UPI001CE04508|nr:phospholipase D family protein [Pseudoxanthomonas sp. PXM03]